MTTQTAYRWFNEAERVAKRSECAECGGPVEPHLQDGQYIVRCVASKGQHRIRRHRPAVQHYVLTGEGNAHTKQLAERRFAMTMDRADHSDVNVPVLPLENGGMAPLSARAMQERIELVRVVYDAMTEGVHYGIIPGTKDKTLLLPGAELLRMAFNITVRYEELEYSQDMDDRGGYVFARYRGYVEALDGRTIHEITRACSSQEPKWRGWRGGDRRHELIDLVPERAQKRCFVELVRHMTGTSGFFKGAMPDLEDVVQTGGLSAEKCPIHGTPWQEGKFGSQHLVTGTREYCKPNKAYLEQFTTAADGAGLTTNEQKAEWLKGHFVGEDMVGKTFSKLTPTEIIDAIEQLHSEADALTELQEPAESTQADAADEPPADAELTDEPEAPTEDAQQPVQAPLA